MRRRRAYPLLLICSLALVVPFPEIAYATGSGTSGWGAGAIGPGGVAVGVGSATPPGSPASTPDPPPSSLPPYYYELVQCTECALNGEVCKANGQLGLIPVAQGTDPVNKLPAGDSVPDYVKIMRSVTNTFEGYLGETLCPQDAAPPPPPPSAAMVWEYVPLPTAQIQVNPGTYGVTQLQSWFSLGDDAADANTAVTGAIDGYRVTLTAHPVAYYWYFGDGASAESSSAGAAGSAGTASATHTYLEPGTYSVGVIVAWVGVYTFTGYGVTETVPLGPVDQPEQILQYRVQEIRSMLLPAG